MSPGNDDRPIERVERALEHEGLVQHVYVHDRKGWHYAWRLTKLGLLLAMCRNADIPCFPRKGCAGNMACAQFESRIGYTLQNDNGNV